MKCTDPLPTKPVVLLDFADRFLDWVNNSRLEDKTRKFYRNGWRLLKATSVAALRIDQITGDYAEQLKFPGAAANANCALRTLRRMLHKAEEWKAISHAPKIKMMKEHGRHLRLDVEAERKLLAAALVCKWRPRTRELFRDIVILMRDTGIRNERELFRMRIENLDWQNRVIFVPDSKTPEGRRLVPMSGRASKFCVPDVMRGRRVLYFPRNAPRPGISDQFAISSGKLATTRAFRKTWFSNVRDMTTARGSCCVPETLPR